jgi:hypothetical protein
MRAIALFVSSYQMTSMRDVSLIMACPSAPLALACEDRQSVGEAGRDLGREKSSLLADRRRIFSLRAEQKLNPRHPCG